jgi:glutamate formiminotransferase/formiminotetrahydrofolate cyclodeaminase
MKKKLVSCIPNFSEGRNTEIIQKIADAIQSVEGVKLLDIDPGKSTNRTVYTFVGEPEFVVEAAFQAIKVAAELIDMRKHRGEHPRMGATDVCPIVPIQNITIEECVNYAHQLAKRVGEELHIPVYLYEYAATAEHRKSLAKIREGEYEGFAKKMQLPEWKPDYGPNVFNEKSGATVIGVRDFLVAYNVNLNTTSVKRANSVAFDVREIGRVKLDEKGNKVLDENGKEVRIPGKLKTVRAIGWYVEEYGFAQVSMNLTNINVASLHDAFQACEESAMQRGLRVTGSEIVGLVPKKCLIDAAKFYLKKQNRSTGLSEEELIQFAVHTLGLNEIKPFEYKKKVIEYAIQEQESEKKLLIHQSIKNFIQKLASENPIPGGGSVAALCGTLAAALTAMVANGSANKKGWEKQIPFFSELAEKFQTHIADLLYYLDEDSKAYEKVMNAYRLPANSADEKVLKEKMIEEANHYAAFVPLLVCKKCFEMLEDMKIILMKGNPNAISDVAAAFQCLQASFYSALYNVKINLKNVNDNNIFTQMHSEIQDLIIKFNQSIQEVFVDLNAKFEIPTKF